MTICGLMVVAGLVAIVRWGDGDVRTPPADGGPPRGPPAPSFVARRYVWYLTVAVVAGLVPGVLLAGAGGRLAMRLLAVTAGEPAQGRVTEADQVVGNITVGGTVGFIVFAGVFFGLATGALYVLLKPWLPGGRLGGFAYGGMLLVVAASRVEPLRAGNRDFDIVGPGWLSVVVFASLVLAHGMLVAAVAGRYSRGLPLLSRRVPAVVAHAPLLLLVPMAPALVPVVAAGTVAVVAARARWVVQALRSRSFTVVGRGLLVAVVVVALPGFVSSVADILGRGP